MRPPYFPVHFSELRGDIRFHDVDGGDVAIGNAKVSGPVRAPLRADRRLPHRVGRRVRRLHQRPPGAPGRLDTVADSVLELCDGVDLLIHDAQYTPDEFAEKAHWGHCTVDYAVLVAKEAGARRLALFHHDPGHDDDFVDQLLDSAQCLGALAGMHEIMAAKEGLVLDL